MMGWRTTNNHPEGFSKQKRGTKGSLRDVDLYQTAPKFNTQAAVVEGQGCIQF